MTTVTNLGELAMTIEDLPVIERAYHGGTESVTFADFAEFVVQDGAMALVIARRMINGDDPYEYNEDEPEFYETFSVADSLELERQVAKFETE
jgi:hypothetical protein